MLMYRRNIEFPRGGFVAHKKKKVAKTFAGLERLTFSKKNHMAIKITKKDAKVKINVGGGI